MAAASAAMARILCIFYYYNPPTGASTVVQIGEYAQFVQQSDVADNPDAVRSAHFVHPLVFKGGVTSA